MTIDQFIQGFRTRTVIVLSVLVLVHLALLGRLWHEQGNQSEMHRQSISRQSIRRLRVPPVRGRIYTRDGRLMTDNVPSYDVLFHIYEMRQPKRRNGPTTVEFVAQTIESVCEVLQRDKVVTDLMLRKLSRIEGRQAAKDLGDDRMAELRLILATARDPEERGVYHASSLSADQLLTIYRMDIYLQVMRHSRVYPALPMTTFTDLNEEELARLSTVMPPFLGLEISTDMARIYPMGDVGAHLVGFVGRLDPEQEEDREEYYYFRPELAGKAGLEQLYNKQLKGVGGGRLMRVDSMGMFYDEIQETQAPVHGSDLILNLDAQAMQISQELMRGQRGGMVVLEVNTGAVIAMVSSPSYDLRVLGTETYGAWAQDEENMPLFNRVLSGSYESGSIIKPMVALAAMHNGVITADHIVHCPGYYQLGDTRIRCARRSGHGDIDLQKAIEVSCNTYFISIGLETGVEHLSEMFMHGGIGQQAGLELASNDGLLPGRAEMQKRNRRSWRAGDTALISIGQGFIGLSPLQAAVYTAAIANDGLLLRPRLVKGIRDQAGNMEMVTRTDVRGTLPVTPEQLQIVREGMHRVVYGSEASAPSAQSSVIELAGKTGTAEIGSRQNRRKNTWFVCFGPYADPKYAVAVLVEEGVSGGKSAAPIAREFFEQWLVGQNRENASVQ